MMFHDALGTKKYCRLTVVCIPFVDPDQLAVGSYFVTVTKPLQSTRWQAMHEEKFHMSWGRATVIVQKKMF